MLNQEQINGKWTEIKGGLRNLWGKLTDDELEKIKGNIQSVSGTVQGKYGETNDSITKTLHTLMDSFDNKTDKSLNLNDGESSFERNPTSEKPSRYSEYENEAEEFETRLSPKPDSGQESEDRIARH